MKNVKEKLPALEREHPIPVLRIRDVYLGSRIRMRIKEFKYINSVADPDPGSGIRCLFDPLIRDPGSRIPDPGSRIPDPGSRIPNPKTIFGRAF